MLIGFFLVVGITSRSKLNLDMFPKIDFPVVTILTVYPGAGPGEVETLISKRIEDALSSIDGIDEIFSTSSEGLSAVVVQFVLEKDIADAAQEVREKIGLIKNEFPEDADEPIVSRLDFNAQPIVYYGVSAKGMDEVELRDFVDKRIRTQLSRIEGVANVELIGGAEREIRIELDRARMEGLGIGPQAIGAALAGTNFDFPAGEFDEGGQNLSIKVASQFTTLAEIENTLVRFPGGVIRLAEIASVIDGSKRQKSKGRINGISGVTIAVQKQSGTNTVRVAKDVKAKMDELSKTAPENVSIVLAADDSRFIEASVNDIFFTIYIGAILAAVVVLVFLGSSRSTLAIVLAIPVSIISTFTLFLIADFTINFMSLMALAVAVGLVVDDAIVVTENIYRHLQMGKTPLQAAADGASEITLAVITATLSIAAVFIPIGIMEGIIGRFFREFGLGVAFAILVSNLVALTLIPVIMGYLYSASTTFEQIQKSRWIVSKKFDRVYFAIEAFYGRLIEWVLSFKRKIAGTSRFGIYFTGKQFVLGSATVAFILSIALAATIPSGFMPKMDSGTVSISLELPPDVDLETTEQTVMEIEKRLEKVEGLRASVASIGEVQAGMGSSSGKNRANIVLNLVPVDERNYSSFELVDTLSKDFADIPNVVIKVSAGEGGGGGDSAFSVIIVNTDVARLEKAAEMLRSKLAEIEGTVDVDTSNKKGKLELVINPDFARVADLGFTPVGLAAALRQFIEGAKLGTFREVGEEYDITMYLAPDQTNSVDKIKNLLVMSPALGRFVSIASMADVSIRPSAVKQERYNRSASVTLSCNIDPKSPRGVGDIRRDFLAAVAQTDLPPDTAIEFSGQAKWFMEMLTQLGIAMLLAIIFVFMVLASEFNSIVHPFNIMLTLPLAIIGAILAIFVTGSSFDMMSFIGIVMLTGLVTKNAILLIDYTNILRSRGIERTEALISACKTRLRPILMTALTTIMALVPVAMGIGEGGGFRAPMGIAIIGGMTVSTLLTLFVVPVAYTISDEVTNRILRRNPQN